MLHNLLVVKNAALAGWITRGNSITLARIGSTPFIVLNAEPSVGQSLLDLSGFIEFFVGLFALVSPVGILPVFISMTSYQAEAGRNKPT